MTEPNPKAQRSPSEPGETPEDVATLYSWANLHGAKYRDFSSSRAEAREEARLRVEEAKAIEQRRLNEEAERKAQEEAQIASRLAAEAAEAARQAEAERLAEIARQADAERQAVLAAQEAQRLAVQQRLRQPVVQPGQPSQTIQPSQLFQNVQPLHTQPIGDPPTHPITANFYTERHASDFAAASTHPAAHFVQDAVQGNAHTSNIQAMPAESYKGFLKQNPEPPREADLRSPPMLTGVSPSPMKPSSRPHDPFASSAQVQPVAPTSEYSFQDPYQVSHSKLSPDAHQAAPTPVTSAPSYFATEEYLNFETPNTNRSQFNQQPAAQSSVYEYPNSHYQPEPFRAPNYEAPIQNFLAYQPPVISSQGGALFPYPLADNSPTNSQSSSAPYVPQLVDTYSPWQPPPPRETPQELYEQRESLSRPAWLIPELVTERSPASIPQQAVPRSQSQAQYSAGTMPSTAPAKIDQQTQPAQPYASHGQPHATSGLPASGSLPTGSLPTGSPTPGGNFSAPNFQAGAPPHPAYRSNPSTDQMTREVAGQAPNQSASWVPPPPSNAADTLLGSRDRISQRWYALKSVFDPQAPVEQASVQTPVRVPALAVFSLAGGVGKTSIVAALGRALSSRGERVLLVDTATYGLLPFFFGARDQRPGMLRTFNPPGVSVDAPVQLVTLDPDGHAPDSQNQDPSRQQYPQDQNQDWLPLEIARYSRNSSRILIDLPTASGATTRRILKLAPRVLVPVVPDMSSVVSVGAIESFFRHSADSSGPTSQIAAPIMPYYVLNQFDYSLPLHLDVREVLREQIGDRLLPFALRRNPAISEALAEGMTVMDYAPTATVAEDYANLAGWVRSISAPANVSQRGVRWSER